jgi:hypothetical protein
MRLLQLSLAAGIAIIACSIFSLAQDPSERAKPELTAAEVDVLALKQAEAEYTKALVNADSEALKRLVADDYSAFNTKGVALKTTRDSLINNNTDHSSVIILSLVAALIAKYPFLAAARSPSSSRSHPQPAVSIGPSPYLKPGCCDIS